jgi:FkbM family methyltransferase
MNGAKRNLALRYFPDGDVDERCRGRVVVDVGANIGIFSMLALAHGASKVIAIEADPAAFRSLRSNIGDDPRVELYQSLLSDKNGRTRFFLATQSGDSSMIEPTSYDEIIDVAAVRLDELIRLSDGDVLKVEAEGAEPEVLRGATRLLDGTKLFVTVRASFERRGESTWSECAEVLKEFGYESRPGDSQQMPKQLLAEKRSTDS